MPARERDRLDDLLRRSRAAARARGAAAHIGRPHVGVLEVARFDRAAARPGRRRRRCLRGVRTSAAAERTDAVRRAAIAALAGHDLAHARARPPRRSACSSRGSSPARMKVPMPSSSASAREPIGELDGVGGELPDVQEPPDLARIAPDRCRRLVDRRVALRRGRPASCTRAKGASRRPCARSARACAACRRRSRSGCREPARGPRLAPWTRWCRPSVKTPRRSLVSHSSRMTSIASSSAVTACPGVSRVPPIASIASQNPPAPSARSNRPPESRSRLAALRATTGRRPQRDVEHVGGDADALGPRRDEGHERPRVQERRLVRVVLEGDQVESGGLGRLTEQHRDLGSAAAGVMKAPNSSACP